jgi:hypothetical protein
MATAPPAGWNSRPHSSAAEDPCMQSSHQAAARLAAIDALQDDLLRRLDELERKTLEVLKECQAIVGPTISPTLPLPAPASPQTVAIRDAA